jgi:hypothetical protein
MHANTAHFTLGKRSVCFPLSVLLHLIKLRDTPIMIAIELAAIEKNNRRVN